MFRGPRRRWIASAEPRRPATLPSRRKPRPTTNPRLSRRLCFPDRANRRLSGAFRVEAMSDGRSEWEPSKRPSGSAASGARRGSRRRLSGIARDTSRRFHQGVLLRPTIYSRFAAGTKRSMGSRLQMLLGSGVERFSS